MTPPHPVPWPRRAWLPLRRWLRRTLPLLALASALLGQAPAWAHKPSDSYLTLRANGTEQIEVRWDIALRDLDFVLQLDRDGDGQLTWGEVRQRSTDIASYATQHLDLVLAGPCQWQPPAPLQLDRHSDGTYAVLSLQAHCPAGPASALRVRYALLFDVDPLHRGLLQWLAPGASGPQALVFAPESAEQALALSGPSAWQTLRQYLADGVWHIWIGFDHILFLLSLLLPSVLAWHDGRWQGIARPGLAVTEVLKVVTAFTLAHSLTLSLAALGVVSLPSRWVESAIAASVIVAALSNLRAQHGGRRWPMAFGFGLVHGFGFASVLNDLGLPSEALALALVGFNAGVELGQLAIVAAFLPLAYTLRRTPFYQWGVFRGGSVAVAALACYWLAQRLFDL